MTIIDLLNKTSKILFENSNQDARFETEVILCHVMGISRTQLYANLKQNLQQNEITSFLELIERRLNQEPVAYITKHHEFYGIDYYVDQRVLIPRPETELLVEEALEFAENYFRNEPLTIADIGTGCGCIAISLALNLPFARIYAVDISTNAIEVAHLNCEKHNVSDRIILRCDNLLTPLTEPVHIIVANLPYLSNIEMDNLSPQVKDFEPRLALNGGHNGFDIIHQLLSDTDKHLHPGGCLLLEIGQQQGATITSFINNLFPQVKIELLPDLNSVDRVIKATF